MCPCMTLIHMYIELRYAAATSLVFDVVVFLMTLVKFRGAVRGTGAKYANLPRLLIRDGEYVGNKSLLYCPN